MQMRPARVPSTGHSQTVTTHFTDDAMGHPPFRNGWSLLAGLLLALHSLLLPATPGLSAGPQEPGQPPRVTADSFDATATPASNDRASRGGELVQHQMARDGLAVVFSAALVQPPPQFPRELREGDDVVWRFTLTETTTGTPLTNLSPAAWLALRSPGESSEAHACRKKAETLIGGSLFAAAELDLNVYYVLALNDDATLTVVDPRFGFGGTKLLALVDLPSPGEDWALTTNQARLFVSMPEAQQVAVVDTTSWQVRARLDVGPHPTRLALQPDEHYLWVTYGTSGGDATDSGVAVITTASLEVVARLPLGRGPHDITFSDDNRFAFVTNTAAGTVSLIDVRQLAKLSDLPTGLRPTSVAFATRAGTAYVTHAGDGSIVSIDANRQQVVARLTAEPGLGRLKFAPGGRLGFVVNPEKNLIHIIDTATNQIVQTGDMAEGPDQIAFSDKLAYVRHRGSATVLMIPLGEVGHAGQPVPVVDFPAGQYAPARASRPSLADSIVRAPGAHAVLVANPADRAIYFYKEGMAAPMGHFRNYNREPRAVLVVDRSLQERSARGVYETVAKAPRPGLYDVVFFVNTPRVLHCFEVAVAANPELEQQRPGHQVTIAPLLDTRTVPVGQRIRLPLQLTDPGTKSPKADLQDVQVLVLLAPGIWSQRQEATHVGDGIYTIDFVPPQAGIYYIYVACRSLGLTFNNPQYVVLEARPKIQAGTD